MHLCISELGSPSLTSIAILCSCNSTMLKDKEWATVRVASFPGLPRGEGRPGTHCSRMRGNF